MMTYSFPLLQQDTVKGKAIVAEDSSEIKLDNKSTNNTQHPEDSGVHILKPVNKFPDIIYADTTEFCRRNSIYDVTFCDPDNIITNIDSFNYKRFPFTFIEKSRQLQAETEAALIKTLKPGVNLPLKPFHDDWIIIIILFTTFLFSLIHKSSKRILPDISRFFLFKGINDPSSRDIGALFHWQSTILNLVSFIIISLFGYSAAFYYNLKLSGINGIVIWLIILGLIITAVTMRHIICTISGNASGERDLFREYLLIVYHSYRYSAIVLFVVIVLIFYTVFLPAGVFIISGIIVLGIMYLIRVLRLMIIFINRNISIFYLILYLCALEILPVVISVKYFTGLF